MPKTMTLGVDDDLQAYAQQLVVGGQYASIDDAVRALREKQAASSLALLQTLIDEGENSGTPVAVEADAFIAQRQTLRVQPKVSR